MPIELAASGFHEWHDRIHSVPFLAVNSDRLDDCIAHYRAGGFRGLLGNPTFGFKQDNPGFLSRTPDVTHLWFWDVELRNIDAVYELQRLEYVGINPARPGIDFSRFPFLRRAMNHWIKSDRGITNSAISIYHLWHYRPRTKTFAGLEIPQGVTELQLFWANPQSLSGLPELKNLKELQIHRCRNLTDLSALPRIAPNLEKFLATTSSKLNPAAGIVEHPKLKTALIDGKEYIRTR